jgi:hypothetical protein
MTIPPDGFSEALSAADEALLEGIGEVFNTRSLPPPVTVQTAATTTFTTVNQVVNGGPSSSSNPHRRELLLGPATTNYLVHPRPGEIGPNDLQGENLMRFDCDPLFVADAVELFGIAALEGEPFACVLPGHTHEADSAVLSRGVQGDLLYVDVHAHSAREMFTLADVYASLHSGRTAHRPRSSHAVFKLDLLRELGWIEPAPVLIRVLPDTASKAAKVLRERFAVLMGLRALRSDGKEAVPYSKRFAADWCGLSPSTALRGITELFDNGVIVHAGSHASSSLEAREWWSETREYLPGAVIG